MHSCYVCECTWISIHMYGCMGVHGCTQSVRSADRYIHELHVYICTSLHPYEYLYLSIYHIYISTCLYVCIAAICAIHVCAHGYLYMCTDAWAHTHAHSQVGGETDTHIHTHICISLHTYKHRYPSIYLSIAYISTYMYRCMHSCYEYVYIDI